MSLKALLVSRHVLCNHLHHNTNAWIHPSIYAVRYSRIQPAVKTVSPEITEERKRVTKPHSKLENIKLVDIEEVRWKPVEHLTVDTTVKYWLRLSKFRLTSLVVLTTLAGFYLASNTIDPGLMAATLAGTALTSSAAASFNQYLEVPYDCQMKRTRNRPLVLGQVSPLHAATFSVVAGASGLLILSTFVNPLTASLGAFNLILYSFIYTPMKRANIVNTWIGSVVGAIPPVMGFTAVTGTLDTSCLLVGLLLYSWQFPHFNALSWNYRHEYARAGYRMMAVTNPSLCVNTALRHSCLIACYTQLIWYVGLTSWTFAIDSLPFNLYLIYLSWKFKSNPDASSSRKLFRYSLLHLPAIIILMLASKADREPEEQNKLEANKTS